MYRPEEFGKDAPEPDWVKQEREMFGQYRDKDGDGKLNKVNFRYLSDLICDFMMLLSIFGHLVRTS